MLGIEIATLLKANPALLELVDTNSIFPYVANEDTPLPLIIYTINDLDCEYTKDGWAGDTYNFSVISFSKNYANLQLVVAQVREALEWEQGTNTGRILLTGQSEGYNINEDVFLNKLSFSVIILNY